jgi:hypothetical protein
MGLAVLLSVGKSLRVAKDLPHRYRSSPRRRVPRFEPAVRKHEDGETRMKTEMKNALEKADGEKRTSVAKPVDGQNPPPSGSAGSGSGARLARPWWDIGAWLSLERWGLKKPALPRRFAGQAQGPVQQELSLENLKPCRNDLSDADWELAQPPASGAKLAFLRQLANSGKAASKGGKDASRAVSAARI